MRIQQVMEWTPVYRAWMAPFADAKLSPLLKNNDLTRVGRVLDIGCGPGTNAHVFEHCDYLGIDINEAYIESARRRLKRKFVAADVTKYEVAPGERFDFVLANSLLHHLNDAEVDTLLNRMAELLRDGGRVHIIELVLPKDRGVPRALARWDRGRYARPLETWREIFSRHFSCEIFDPFTVSKAGIALWNFVYFRGGRRG